MKSRTCFSRPIRRVPSQVASRDGGSIRLSAPLRVVEHVRLKPVPEHEVPCRASKILEAWESAARRVQSLKAEVRCFRYDHKPRSNSGRWGTLTYSKSA